MDFLPSDTKKKDPDSFSLDPDGPDLLESADIIKRPNQIDVDFNLGPVLSSIIASPKLPSPKHHKIDSFSQEDTKQVPKQKNYSDFPLPIQLSLSLCEAFSQETKVVKKMKNFISTMNENLRLTEQLLKTQENRIDEFFQEVYDLFISNFQTTTELYKQNLKNKLKQEFDDYCLTHELMKSNLETILANDSFPKILQQELFTFASHNNPLNNANLNGGAEGENKADMESQFIQFVNNSMDLKLGLTPLVKKFKLIEYSIQSRIEKPLISQNISQNASEIRKEPLKDFADIYSELENFVSRVSSNFSHEISSILHPHSPFISTVEKIARNTAKILPFPFDPTAKYASQWDLEEVITRKRLSQIMEPPKQEVDEEESEKEKDKETEKELLRSPPLSSRSISGETGRAPPSLTPVKNVTYKVPAKENSFTADAGWFNSEMGEIAYQTQLISVHNHLSVGDLVSVNSVPYRILHKEWIFPEDIVQMCNIFTGEIIEVKYHSRHSGMEDQIITKKLEVIAINTKKGYYLLMEPNWDKSDTCRRLPNIIEMKDVLDKGLEEDIKENFNSDKKVVVHVLRIKDKDIIVSYRKEWL